MSKILAAFALREAKLGHLAPLISRVLTAATLTTGEREFIAAALERLDGKRGKAELRRVEKVLIALRVEGLINEEGLLPKAAVTQVMKERGRKRSTIYKAISESKKL